jgi:hypothetical protein
MFNDIRPAKLASEEDVSLNIDVENKTCACGEWKDLGFHCLHAIAYFKMHKRVLLEEVMSEHINRHYTYESERMLLRKNIVPICMELVRYDGSTLPPKQSMKRSTGRPKKVRLRKRSRWAHDPEKSNIVCSRCHVRGNNIRTCLVREGLKNNRADMNKRNELDLSSMSQSL